MARLPGLAVTLGLWQDRPANEALETAEVADAAGFDKLWIGEMATFDAFALATAIGHRTHRIGLTIGPLAAAVRDPMMIAVGVASVAALTGRRVDVALGTSSPMVVEKWHGRPRVRSARALAESARAVRGLLDGDKVDLEGEVLSTHGYRLRLGAPQSEVAIAAFGPSAVRVAARQGDRMVPNLLTPKSASRIVEQLHEAATQAGRPPPPVSAWVVVAVDPSPSAIERARRAVVGYLAAPGYAEMFIEAGFASVVELARSRPHPSELLAAVPAELIEAVGLVGSVDAVRAGLAAYGEAGVDEVATVPTCTDDDPAGARTLRALAELREPEPPAP